MKLQPYQHGGIYRGIREYGRKGHWGELRECYKESLIATLRTLASYVNLFSDGRLVISADHGELIGEPSFDGKGMYWHKVHGDGEVRKLLERTLMTVPWFETEIAEWRL